VLESLSDEDDGLAVDLGEGFDVVVGERSSVKMLSSSLQQFFDVLQQYWFLAQVWSGS
jgi:hypothetical protein